MSKITLSYFDLPGGRGEDCRIAMFMAGVEFEDERIGFADWPERKSSTPLGALPVMTVEGKGTLTQSNAILTYIGRSHGLHPTDLWDAARHEALLGASEDLRVAVVPTFYMQDEEEKKKAREELACTTVHAWGALVESEIAGPFLSGDTLHVTDLRLYVMAEWFLGGVVEYTPSDVFDDFPKLKALRDAVKSHEQVVAWYAR